MLIMVPPDDRERIEAVFGADLIFRLFTHITPNSAAKTPLTRPGKKPAATAGPGNAGHCWVSDPEIEGPIGGDVADAGAALTEEPVDTAVTGIEAAVVEVGDAEMDEVAPGDVALLRVHMLPP
jgi:hypothetical protein